MLFWLVVFVLFETPFQISERLKAMAFVFANTALGELVNRHWIEVMQLLAPAPDDGDQIRRLQQQEMFGDRLPRHVEVRAQLAKRPPVALVQLVEQLSTALVRQGFEHSIHLAEHYATFWLPVKGKKCGRRRWLLKFRRFYFFSADSCGR
jgi:hypothetical protein